MTTVLSKPQVAAGDSEELRRFVREKHALAGCLRSMEELFRRSAHEQRASKCHEMMVKLAEDRFTLAVVGQFKRGKSSLMNAIIGRNLLPTGVLPLTSAITALRYGPVERLVIHWADSDFVQEAPVSSLREYVTEEGNPGNRRRVETVYVEVASPFLRRGLEFVDTPGIGSPIEANTTTTYNFVPKCDAVLFVTSVDAPFSAAEIEFLKRIREEVHKVFFVVNKIDLLAEAERAGVVRFVGDAIRSVVKSDDLQIFPISSRLGLERSQAKSNGDPDHGGIESLEHALATFLTTERTSSFLFGTLERCLRLLRADRREAEFAKMASEMSATARDASVARVRARFEVLARAVQQRLADARRKLLDTVIAAPADELAQLTVAPLVEGLARQVVAGQWESAHHFAQVVADSAAAAMRCILNDWLAQRRHTADLQLRQIVDRESDFLKQQLQSAGADVQIAFEARSPTEEENAPTLPVPELATFRIEQRVWTPILPWTIRYLPVDLVARRLRKLLRAQAADYSAACRAAASELAESALTTAVDQLQSLMMEAVETEQGRLLDALSRPFMSTSSVNSKQITFNEYSQTAAAIEKRLLHLLDPNAVVHETAPGYEEPAIAVEHRAVTREAPDPGLSKKGCAICDHLSRVLFDFLAGWQYELATDDQIQSLHAAEGGFCPIHTWQLAAISSPKGLSIGYPKLLERLAEELLAVDGGGSDSEKALPLVAKERTCRVCRVVRDARTRFVSRLAALLETLDGRQAYSQSLGVCLRHLPELVAAIPSEDGRRFVISETARHCAALAEDMHNFAMKQDATRRYLQSSDETDAWVRALRLIAGHKSQCLPWEPEPEV